MTTPLSEALSPQIQAQLPPRIQSLEDLALTSPRDIAGRKGWEWIDVARRHLARTYLRRIERTSDAELTVTVRVPPNIPKELQPRLLALCAIAAAELYVDNFAAEWAGDDAIRVRPAFNYETQRAQFLGFTSKEPEPLASVVQPQAVEAAPASVPPDLFEPIVGYEDLKDAFARAVDPARRPVHVLLVGPPASAKSLFLLQVGKLPGAYGVLGGTTSKAGLAQVLIEEQPSYVLIDELDKMDREDLSVLLSLCESGRVSVTKYARRQQVDLPATRVFAAANSDAKIPRELLSRFLRFRLRPYSRGEFVDVVTRILPATEGTDADLAAYIGEKLAQRLRMADVRDSVRLARLAQSKEEVDGLLATMGKYS